MAVSVRTQYRKYHKLNFADEEIYDEIIKLVDSSRNNLKETKKNDYRKVLSECFRLYVEIAQDTIDDAQIVHEIKLSCAYIKNAIKSVYEGLHARAFRQLQNYLPKLSDSLYCEIPMGQYFYRMRVCDKRKNLSRKDIFHIPLEAIRKIATQRYSSPGYPCLYLANSLYACWEEMNRPNADKALASCYKNKTSLKLVDLRVPSLDTFLKNDKKYAQLFPLILACSIPVKNHEDVYKPEYALPQLMIEWVISNRRKIGAIGIYYTSVFKNDDFFPCLTEEWDNIAMPVFKPLSPKEFCPKLIDLFDLTLPTCYEYEKLKGNIDGATISSLEVGDSKDEDYRKSLFSRMKTLMKTNVFNKADCDEMD